MAQQFKEYLDKETYLLFEEDGEKFCFSSNNPSVQKWCESVKNKKVKRDAVKFVVKAAKDYMKNPHQKEDFDRSPKPLADKVEAVFLATPEEVQKVVQDLQAAATKTEDKDKAQKYTTAATAASMRVNLFKNMGKKSPLTATYQANIEPYEIKVPQPEGNAHTRGGKSIGE